MASPKLIEILNKTSEHFKTKGIENFRLDAQLIIGHILNLDRISLYFNYDRPFSDAELEQCRNLVRRRSAREPLQHIIGKTFFRELTLKSDKRALIPRKETEIIVDLIQETAADIKTIAINAPISIIDIGVGAGPIFLSLKKESPDLDIYGVEISKDASLLFEENAELNNLSIEGFRLGENFKPFPADKTWNIIAANPPYISEDEFCTLEPEVRIWDPREALVSEERGYGHAFSLLDLSRSRLKDNGCLILEVGCNQSGLLSKKSIELGWKKFEIRKDYSGQDRFITFYK